MWRKDSEISERAFGGGDFDGSRTVEIVCPEILNHRHVDGGAGSRHPAQYDLDLFQAVADAADVPRPLEPFPVAAAIEAECIAVLK